MATLTIRLPDDTHERLRQLAQSRGVSLNKLFEEFSVAGLAEFDAQTRFRVLAAQGDTRPKHWPFSRSSMPISRTMGELYSRQGVYMPWGLRCSPPWPSPI